MSESPDLRVQIGSLTLANPILVASGTFGYAHEFAEFMDLNQLGGIVTKTITVHPRLGNPPPRTVETPAGMLNAIGLQNVGLDGFIEEKLPFLRTLTTPLIVNVAGKTVEEFATLVERVSSVEGPRAIELNISCPNVTGGLDFAVDPKLTEEVVRTAKARTHLPVVCKLSPNVTDIRVIARAAEAGGADALSLINTLIGLVVDIEQRRPVLANVTGGLSGPAIRPIAVRMVWQVAQIVSVPVIGIGGIMTHEDALQHLIAGATAVQVGTANFVNVRSAVEILEGLKRWLKGRAIGSVGEVVGTLETR